MVLCSLGFCLNFTNIFVFFIYVLLLLFLYCVVLKQQIFLEVQLIT